MTDFEKTVLADLSELKAHMRWLVGNGKAGCIQELTQRVERHERFVQRMGGIVAAREPGPLLDLLRAREGADHLAPRPVRGLPAVVTVPRSALRARVHEALAPVEEHEVEARGERDP